MKLIVVHETYGAAHRLFGKAAQTSPRDVALEIGQRVDGSIGGDDAADQLTAGGEICFLGFCLDPDPQPLLRRCRFDDAVKTPKARKVDFELARRADDGCGRARVVAAAADSRGCNDKNRRQKSTRRSHAALFPEMT